MPALISTAPSSTVTHAFSFTWWSPSDWPGLSTISTARAPSSEWRTIGSACPVGGIEVEEVPALHRESVSERGYTQTLLMPLAVDSFVMGPFQSNCYVVRSERGAAEAAVIDPGGDPTRAPARAGAARARTAGILVTHTDVDHIGGVAALAGRDRRGGLGARGRGRGAAQRRDARRRSRVPPHEPAHTVAGGDEVDRRRASTFEVSTFPGHSVGHVAFHTDGELFSGDLLFAGSVGRVDLPGGDWETLLDSVRRLLERFPARDRRLSRARARDDARPRARDEPVPRASCARPRA